MTETHVALCSGGQDSAVATREAVVNGPCEVVVHLDTGTGLDENEEWVRSFARGLGAQCWTLSTHEDYEKIVQEHGFPGPSRHAIMYRRLKERQIQKLASKVAGELHCWTGVRAMESERRMRTVEADGEHDGGRWYWHAPIHDWSKEECQEYIDDHEIEPNPVWDALGRSGDCWCGCFASPEEILDAEAAGFEDHAEWIRGLEDLVDDSDDLKRKEKRWAGHAYEAHDWARDDDKQVTLCSSCGVDYPVPDGGQPATDYGGDSDGDAK